MIKKIITISLILTMIFAFAACQTEQNTEDEATENSATQSAIAEFGTNPTVYAVVSNANPAIGEEITVAVKLCNAGLFSSIDLVADYDSNVLDVEYTSVGTIPDLVDTLKVDTGKISYGGFVMRSAEVTDETLFELAVTPLPGAGGTQTIQLSGINFLIALDAEGNETADKTNLLQTENIVINVQ
ncbi:MAG: hypothetical protein IKJ63_04815 [Clostridia bacterium]|nr:hypothetical protein [Clostridia bacterium]MBR2414585.1 hypothetical protein [Clostridia bacterium]MBR3954774.1 hypothetical protein [Clostridia bacterium]